MKKIVLIVLLAMTISICTFSYAEDISDDSIDFSSYSNIELIETRNKIDKELATRGNTQQIYEGVYTVGQDIKAGAYIFSAYNDPFYVNVYNDFNAFLEYGKLYDDYLIEYDSVGRARQNGENLSYPKRPIITGYGDKYYVHDDSTMRINIFDNQVIEIEDSGFFGEGILTISKPTSLFMD